jgi:hypothetical protein
MKRDEQESAEDTTAFVLKLRAMEATGTPSGEAEPMSVERNVQRRGRTAVSSAP